MSGHRRPLGERSKLLAAVAEIEVLSGAKFLGVTASALASAESDGSGDTWSGATRGRSGRVVATAT